MKFETRAIHIGEEPNCKDGGSGDVVIPIHMASTFARKEVDHPTGGYEYSRTGNPTRYALEKRLASLENARFGLAFASGLAAETTIFLSLLSAGDHVIAFDDLYGGSRRLFTQIFQKNHDIQLTYVDARYPDKVKLAIQDNTKMVWLETPTNPLLKLCDIQLLADFAHSRNLLVVVDNTFMSPFFQQPMQLGADLILHSTTKYLNGHSDTVGGAILTNHQELYEKLKFAQNAAGTMLSPFDSFLLLRGIKTLSVRMRQHEENALTIARYLEQSPYVKKVIYPGLPSHPQYDLAKRQMSGFGGMISFELDGNINTSRQFLRHLDIFAVAESLGGVESLIEHPALMTHASVPPEVRAELGISDTLIRLSVGIENVDDLIKDLEYAFKQLDR